MYPLPIVTVTYRGEPLTEQLYREHPEIHHLYPTREAFMQEHYLPLVERVRRTGVMHELVIDEDGVRVNVRSR
jgi:hypothetical protein